MNNKKIFSVNLFWQSFKQLKLIGILSSVILMVLSSFVIIGQGVSMLLLEKEEGIIVTPTVISGIDEHTFIFIVFIVITPILALNAWNFLNKRSTSDFYHSLPYKRQCLYLCRVAAVFAWQLIILVTTFLTIVISYAIFSKYFIVDYMMIFRLFVATFNCSLLCFGGISIACALTGNEFSNVCVSGLILFFPRMMIFMISSAVASAVPILSESHIMPFLDNSVNMITGILFSSSSPTALVLSTSTNIYTFMLGVIYLIIGCILFVRRKSEGAGSAAIGKVTQFVIRTVIAFTICAFTCLSLLMDIRDGYDITASDVTAIIFIFVIAAIIVIVYECIASRNIRKIVACFPSIIAAYVLSVVFVFAMNITMDIQLDYKPQADDIKYVKLSKQEHYYYGEEDYFQNITKHIKIDSNKIKKVVAQALENNIKLIKENKDVLLYNERYTCYEVYIKDGFLGSYRNIYFTSSELNEIAESLANIEAYRNAYYDLPTADEVTVYSSNSELTDKQNKELYTMLVEEAKKLSFAEWHNIVNGDNYNQASVYATFTRNGTIYSMELPIVLKCEKTYNEYLNMCNSSFIDDSDALKQLKASIRDYLDGSIDKVYEKYDEETGAYRYESVEFEIFECPSCDEVMWFSLYDYLDMYGDVGETVTEKVLDVLNNPKKDIQFDVNKPIIRVHYYLDTEHYSYSYEFNIQLDGYDKIKDYVPNYEEYMDEAIEKYQSVYEMKY